MTKFVLLPLLLALAGSGRAADTLVAFDIEDQSGGRHTDTAFRGKVVVLIGSDRGGSAYNPEWGRALRDSLRHHPYFAGLAFLPVADMRGVPGWVRGIMKKFLPSNRQVLLDWEGRLAGAYGFVPDKGNIVVFAADGRVVRRAVVTGVEAGVMDGVLGAVRHELERTAGAAQGERGSGMRTR